MTLFLTFLSAKPSKLSALCDAGELSVDIVSRCFALALDGVMKLQIAISLITDVSFVYVNLKVHFLYSYSQSSIIQDKDCKSMLSALLDLRFQLLRISLFKSMLTQHFLMLPFSGCILSVHP